MVIFLKKRQVFQNIFFVCFKYAYKSFACERSIVTPAFMPCKRQFFAPAVVFLCVFLFLHALQAAIPITSSALKPCAPIEDPFEKTNRVIFAFNQGVDGFLVNPALVVYTFFVPPPLRRGVQNVFNNLNEPASMVSHFFQGRNKDGRRTLLRFLINSTLGLLGLFDVAKRMGIERTPNNFNNTLQYWGITAGPYTVWPVLGPFSMRDSLGGIVDFFLDPFNAITWGLDANELLNWKVGIFYAVEREKYWKEVEGLKENAVDAYAMVRSLYFQKRHCGLALKKSPDFFLSDGPEPTVD